MKKEELKAIMANFYGTENYYKHPLVGITYTDGVQAFAENAGAYWFITDCGLFVKEAIKANPEEEMFAIHLVVEGDKADVIYRDGNNKAVYTRHYSFTDCPEGDWLFYYFKSEHLLIWSGEY